MTNDNTTIHPDAIGPTIKAGDLLFGDRWLVTSPTLSRTTETKLVEFLEFQPVTGGTFLLATVLDPSAGETHDIVLLDTDRIGPVSRAATRPDDRLPRSCVVQHPTQESKMVIVTRGAHGYREWGASLRAAVLHNTAHGATPAIHAAMLAGATLGWDHPTARLPGGAS